MTANQINYARTKEDRRHNLVTEEQKLRDIAIGERQALAAELQASTASKRQLEDARHNRESETINWFSTRNQIAETQRHNREQEQVSWFSAQSQDRHNYEMRQIQSRQADAAQLQATTAWNALGIQRLDANTRARQAAVAEQQLGINRRQASVAERQAAVAERNAAVNEGQLGVSRRLASASEAQASAAITSASASQTSARAAYTNAVANQANALTRQGELSESIRRNTINLAEQERHNREAESIAQAQANASLKQAEASLSQASSAETRAQTDKFRSRREVADTVIHGVDVVGGLAASILKKGRR